MVNDINYKQSYFRNLLVWKMLIISSGYFVVHQSGTPSNYVQFTVDHKIQCAFSFIVNVINW